MKKILIGSLAVSILAIPLFAGMPTNASCPSSIFVGSETISGCPGAPSPEIAGFTLDLDNSKITLNNYSGGGIYYLCRGSCSATKNFEVELIGENTINSKLSQAYPQENGVPTIIDAGFINITPTFTGSGTLTINASDPITFESNVTSFDIKLVGSDFIAEPAPTQTAAISAADTTDSIAQAAPAPSEPAPAETSFFATTTGIITLIAIPSSLMLIAIILLIVLIIKMSHRHPTTPNTPPAPYTQ